MTLDLDALEKLARSDVDRLDRGTWSLIENSWNPRDILALILRIRELEEDCRDAAGLMFRANCSVTELQAQLAAMEESRDRCFQATLDEEVEHMETGQALREAEDDRDRWKELALKEVGRDRWAEGAPHHPESMQLMKFLMEVDFHAYNDFFGWKMGGDGDNGEILMYQLDAYFEGRGKP